MMMTKAITINPLWQATINVARLWTLTCLIYAPNAEVARHLVRRMVHEDPRFHFDLDDADMLVTQIDDRPQN